MNQELQQLQSQIAALQSQVSVLSSNFYSHFHDGNVTNRIDFKDIFNVVAGIKTFGGGATPTVTVTDSTVGPRSIVLHAISSSSYTSTNTPIYGYSISSNTITFTSNASSADSSTFVYLIINLPN